MRVGVCVAHGCESLHIRVSAQVTRMYIYTDVGICGGGCVCVCVCVRVCGDTITGSRGCDRIAHAVNTLRLDFGEHFEKGTTLSFKNSKYNV